MKTTSATSSSLVAAEDANGSHQRFGYHLLTGPVCRSMFFRQSNHASGRSIPSAVCAHTPLRQRISGSELCCHHGSHIQRLMYCRHSTEVVAFEFGFVALSQVQRDADQTRHPIVRQPFQLGQHRKRHYIYN